MPYHYDKLATSKLEDYLTYFDKHYEEDKAAARKIGPLEYVATLDMIFITMLTHSVLYKKKFSEEAYNKLNIKKSGKTPLQFVEDEHAVAVKQYSESPKPVQRIAGTHYVIFKPVPLAESKQQSPYHEVSYDSDSDSEGCCESFAQRFC